jgi:hypothetical protein
MYNTEESFVILYHNNNKVNQVLHKVCAKEINDKMGDQNENIGELRTLEFRKLPILWNKQ